MKLRTFNNVLLTEETIMKTRKFFSDNCYACIEEVKQGKCNIYILIKKNILNIKKSKHKAI